MRPKPSSIPHSTGPDGFSASRQNARLSLDGDGWMGPSQTDPARLDSNDWARRPLSKGSTVGLRRTGLASEREARMNRQANTQRPECVT
eukprot:8202989-Alexandrium_andersonii.AAC.1